MINLKVTTIQSDLHWENVNANLNMFAEKIALITDETDIIVLPEMFNTGFSMNSEKLAEANIENVKCISSLTLALGGLMI